LPIRMTLLTLPAMILLQNTFLASAAPISRASYMIAPPTTRLNELARGSFHILFVLFLFYIVAGILTRWVAPPQRRRDCLRRKPWKTGLRDAPGGPLSWFRVNAFHAEASRAHHLAGQPRHRPSASFPTRAIRRQPEEFGGWHEIRPCRSSEPTGPFLGIAQRTGRQRPASISDATRHSADDPTGSL